MVHHLDILVVGRDPELRLKVRRALHGRHETIPSTDDEVEYRVHESAGIDPNRTPSDDTSMDLVVVDTTDDAEECRGVLESLDAQGVRAEVLLVAEARALEQLMRALPLHELEIIAKPFGTHEFRAAVRRISGNLFARRQARQLEEERRQIRFEFVRMLSHELKSPIAAVEGFLHLLRDQTLGEDVGAYGEIVDRCILRLGGMRQLIHDLLEMTRIESRHAPRQLEPLDLASLVDDVLDEFRSMADARRVSLSSEFGDELPFEGDANELRILVSNLVSNAIKYNVDGGRVDVGGRTTEDGVELWVRDTGIGILEENRERLFTEFTRERRDETKNVEGTGLGLSIVRQIAELYGGGVDLESRVGEGTCFRVKLVPVERAESSRQA